MNTKKALITGIAGQDGVYLAQFLLEKGCEVHGVVRWDSDLNALDRYGRFAKLGLSLADVHIHVGDVCDPHFMLTLFHHLRPDEIYHLAAISHVGESFKTPTVSSDVIVSGTRNVLEAMVRLTPKSRFYQASSSEMFGDAPAPQSEASPMRPRSPYAAAKLHAYHMARIYRQAKGVFAANGILFNHESPLRGADFVTQKIAQAVARGEALVLGNLDARRDWGHAADYVRGMWMMLQHATADDFVLATGQDYSVRDFVTAAFAYKGVPLTWSGTGVDEVALDASGAVRVSVSEEFYRPLEVGQLRGDAAKAKTVFGWKPAVSFEMLVAEMVDAGLSE